MNPRRSRRTPHAGHLGDATVQHTAHHLPIIVSEFLHKVVTGPSAPPPAPDVVSDILARAITSFDDAIAGDVLALFPGGLAGLPAHSSAEIRTVLNDYYDGGQNYQKARLCMYGTTALVALVDPAHEHLWVANLGDSDAGESSCPPAPPAPSRTRRADVRPQSWSRRPPRARGSASS